MKKRYISQLGMELSPLGFGVMRLPKEGEEFPEEVYALMDKAMEKGINYYDTAYPYLEGKSEILIREALVKKYNRDSFYIADKLPVWECQNQGDMERIFQVQLERLGVEYIDFYLLHGLHKRRWERAYEIGVLDFLEQKKREGRIRKIGFSFHDTSDVLMQIEQEYSWDFIQLQINYYDWEIMGARDCYEYLAKKNIPCMVMEPVGGGRLSHLPGKAEKILKKISPDRSVSSWAIRFVSSLPNVVVTLSGMSNESQLLDNVREFNVIEKMTEIESHAIEQVVDIIRSYNAIPCSGCRYCVDVCKKGVDIPQIFKRYNDFCMFENMARFDVDYFSFLPEGQRGDSCVQCQSCSKRCPQKIDISQEIKKIHAFAVGLSLGLKEKDWENFVKNYAGEKIICFGAGEQGKRAKRMLQDMKYEVAYFCDNAESKWGTLLDGVEVISPEKMRELYESKGFRILITSIYCEEIKEQLKKMNISCS
ncbi:MAG: hypothetical protein HFH60_07245 [Lachnospiraceae bacterium]|nr:hypothetical protein [Lachnospiraceae bacterium]